MARNPAGSLNVTGTELQINISFESSLSVKYTLSLKNGTLVKGNSAPLNSTNSPIGILSDPVNNYTYVTDSSTNLVYVIDQSGSIIDRITVGQNPSQLVFDNNNGYIYVTNSGSNNVSVINGSNNVVASISVGEFPFGIAYDSSNNYLYVANVFSSSVSIIGSYSNNAGEVVANVRLPSDFLPFSSVYDKSAGMVYFSNVNGNQIAEVQGTELAGYITVKGSPAMMAYDGVNGNVYVTDAQTSASTGYGYLSVIGSSGTVKANITIPGSVNPFGITYDQNRNLIYISDANSNQMIVFNPDNSQFINRINVGSEPYGVSVSQTGNSVEISNFNSGTVSFLGYAGAVRAVTFLESGLPSGTPWAVSVRNTSLSSSTGSIMFNETPGHYTFSPSHIDGYKLGINTNSFNLSGKNLVILVTYQKLFQVNISESGLSSGSPWGFTLDGSTYSTYATYLNLPLVNGTYSLVPYAPSANFTAGSTDFTVNGANISVNIQYVRAYSLNFTESGLKGGTLWSVVVNGTKHTSQTGTIHMMLTKGVYNFTVLNVKGYSLSNKTGRVQVTGSSNDVFIKFRALFSVEFIENGLYPHTQWNATLNGTSRNASADTISFLAVNGTYQFTLGVPEGYLIDRNSGTVEVSGANVTVTVHYTRLYNTTITEKGLARGTGWWAEIGGLNLTGNGTQIHSSLTNGTYTYKVSKVPGYKLVNGSGSFTISGNKAYVAVSYEKIYAIRFVESGLPSIYSWSVLFNGSEYNIRGNSTFIQAINGSYNYSIGSVSQYVPTNPGGIVNVSGSNVTVSLTFIKMMGTLNFTERNAPAGAEWYILLNGTYYHSSQNGSLYIKEHQGNYTYVANYTIYGLNITVQGNVSVGSGKMQVVIDFPELYKVKFKENGLRDKSWWAINMSGYSISSYGDSIIFTLPNGTYNFSVYDSSHQSFNVVIQYWGQGEGDYTASAMVSSSHSASHISQPLMVNGKNITVKVLFNESHDHHHTRHHGWRETLNSIEQAVIQYVVYLEEVVQMAISTITVSLKVYFSIAIPGLSSIPLS